MFETKFLLSFVALVVFGCVKKSETKEKTENTSSVEAANPKPDVLPSGLEVNYVYNITGEKVDFEFAWAVNIEKSLKIDAFRAPGTESKTYEKMHYQCWYVLKTRQNKMDLTRGTQSVFSVPDINWKNYFFEAYGNGLRFRTASNMRNLLPGIRSETAMLDKVTAAQEYNERKRVEAMTHSTPQNIDILAERKALLESYLVDPKQYIIQSVTDWPVDVAIFRAAVMTKIAGSKTVKNTLDVSKYLACGVATYSGFLPAYALCGVTDALRFANELQAPDMEKRLLAYKQSAEGKKPVMGLSVKAFSDDLPYHGWQEVKGLMRQAENEQVVHSGTMCPNPYSLRFLKM